MDIVFSTLDRSDVIVLPFVSPGTSVTNPQSHDVFEGLNFNIKLLGPIGLRTLHISSFFPHRQYPFMSRGSKADPMYYVNWFRRMRETYPAIPLRVVMSDDKRGSLLNMMCAIDEFDWELEKNGSIAYALDVGEYNPVVT